MKEESAHLPPPSTVPSDSHSLKLKESQYNVSISEADNSINLITQSQANSGTYVLSGDVTPHSDHVERLLQANEFLRDENQKLRDELILIHSHLVEERQENLRETLVRTPDSQKLEDRIYLLETQLKKEIEKSNRLRMTSNSVEVLLHNLSSEFKSFRLELISSKNMQETLLSYAKKVPPSIAHFFKQLKEYIKSLQEQKRTEARHNSMTNLPLSQLHGYGMVQSPAQRNISGRHHFFQTYSGLKPERTTRAHYFSKTLGCEELRAFQTEARKLLSQSISRTTTYEEADEFENRIKTTPIRIHLDEVSDFQSQIQLNRVERPISQSLVLDGHSMESTVVNSRKAGSPLRVETVIMELINRMIVQTVKVLSTIMEQESERYHRLIYEFNRPEAVIERMHPLTPKERLTISTEKAEWMANSESKLCLRCSATFGIFNWRHHCRSCGELVCGSCSKGKEYVQGYREKVKVCTKCQAEIRARRAEAKRQGRATLHLCRITEEK